MIRPAKALERLDALGLDATCRALFLVLRTLDRDDAGALARRALS